MAKVMSYADATGNNVNTSYWKIVQINIGIQDHTANIVLYGYMSKNASKTGKQPLAGAVKTYTISGADFDTFMMNHLKPGGKNLLKLAYEDLINATADVPDPTPDNPNQKKNFFAGATDDVD